MEQGLVSQSSGGQLAPLTPYAGSGLSMSDIILPSVALRQNQVAKDKMKPFKPGEIILFPNGTVVADGQKPALFVVVHVEKCFNVSDITDGKPKHVRFEDPYPENKPYEFRENNRLHRRDRAFLAHIIFRESLESQANMIEALRRGEFVDPDDLVLPARIIFSRASLNAGRILCDHFGKSLSLKGPDGKSQSPAFITFSLKSTEAKNDKGTWYAFDVSKPTKDLKFTPKELMGVCDMWVENLRGNKFKSVGDEDATSDIEATVADDKVPF